MAEPMLAGPCIPVRGFVSYEIYRSYDLTQPWSFVASESNVNVTSYFDASARSDSTGVYYLVEINNGPGCFIGYEVRSIHLDVDQVGVTAELNWNRPYTNVAIYNNGTYKIFREDSLGWSQIGTTNFGTETFIDPNFIFNADLKYRVESTDPYNLFAVSNVDSLRIDSSMGTGVEEFDLAKARLYPNPARNELVVEWKGIAQQPFEILDLTGKIVQVGIFEADKANLDITSLKEGIYFVRVVNQSGEVRSLRFVKME